MQNQNSIFQMWLDRIANHPNAFNEIFSVYELLPMYKSPEEIEAEARADELAQVWERQREDWSHERY